MPGLLFEEVRTPSGGGVLWVRTFLTPWGLALRVGNAAARAVARTKNGYFSREIRLGRQAPGSRTDAPRLLWCCGQAPGEQTPGFTTPVGLRFSDLRRKPQKVEFQTQFDDQTKSQFSGLRKAAIHNTVFVD